MVAAFNVLAGRFAGHHWRCTDVAVFAFAVEAADVVSAQRVRTTRIRVAFINVNARSASWDKALLAKALVLDAFGVVGAIEIRFAEYINVDLVRN